MIKPVNCKEGDHIIRLWVHEASRVFHDRLVDDIDRKWFRESIMELL